MINRGIRVHECFGNMRADNVIRRQPHPLSIGVPHAGDFVFSEEDTEGALLARVLRQVHRAAGKLRDAEESHSGLRSTVGGKMLVEIGGAIFDDQRLREWRVSRGGGPRIHENHQRLHIANRMVERDADRRRIVGEMRDAHLAHRPESPSCSGAVHRVDEP